MNERVLLDETYDLGKLRSVASWIAVLALAFLLDGPVARAVAPWRESVKHSTFAEEIKEGGHAGVTAVAVLLLIALYPDKWRAVTLLVGTALVTGGMRSVIAVAAGRVRPVVHVDPLAFFQQGLGLDAMMHAKNLSFPSGHASLAFASAFALSHLLGRGRWLFFGGAALVGLERIAESAHYVSDVVAGALLGMLAFKLTLRLHRALWDALAAAPSQGLSPSRA